MPPPISRRHGPETTARMALMAGRTSDVDLPLGTPNLHYSGSMRESQRVKGLRSKLSSKEFRSFGIDGQDPKP